MPSDLLRALPPSVEAWPEALATMPRDEALALVDAIQRAWAEGAFGASLFPDATSVTEADRRLGRIFGRLPPALAEAGGFERALDGDDDVRRWCWVPGWSGSSQDEDLLLMHDDNVGPLLDEAREGCTKRDYVLSIVEHHARDSSHHALWDGTKRLADTLGRCRSWAPAARAARAEPLATYLERLGRYADRGRVNKVEDVGQRVLDLRRCSPRPETPPVVCRHGAHWRAPFARANLIAGELIVEVATGRMWAEERPKQPKQP